jgi:hypothetical protein
METSTEVIARAKKRFKELEHKGYDWKSFYNGFLEAAMQVKNYDSLDNVSVSYFITKKADKEKKINKEICPKCFDGEIETYTSEYLRIQKMNKKSCKKCNYTWMVNSL